MKRYTRRKNLPQQSTPTPPNINDIPSEILQNIVWRLPAHESARTSILSRHFKNLWLSNPNWVLNPFTIPVDAHKKFVNAVTNIITRHSGSGIQKIRISHLNLQGVLTRSTQFWMDRLAKHPLKELQFDVGHSSSPPPSLFVCESLVDLDLSLYGALITVPSEVKLPNLKKLSLYRVYFSNSKEFKQLLNGCKKLEYLQLDRFYCTAQEGINLKINLPELRVFRFESNYDYAYVRLFAKKIEMLEFKGIHFSVTDRFVFTQMKEVKCFEINQWIRPYLNRKRENELREFGEKMDKVVRAFRDTRSLSLGKWCIEHLTTIADTLTPPTFENLKQLEISFWPNEGHTNMILCIVKYSPYLESLKLITLESICDELYLNENRADYPSPPNLEMEIFTHLTNIEMKHFRGTHDEMKLVADLLSFCPALELFSIKFAQRIKHHVKKRVRTKVPRLLRLSPWVEVTIGNYTLA
ncbi:hypothetical protein LUZ60_008762 [Juncus effusus]|nr:hypothetical protein LUZ60_008762 [Juncus effusus]